MWPRFLSRLGDVFDAFPRPANLPIPVISLEIADAAPLPGYRPIYDQHDAGIVVDYAPTYFDPSRFRRFDIDPGLGGGDGGWY